LFNAAVFFTKFCIVKQKTKKIPYWLKQAIRFAYGLLHESKDKILKNSARFQQGKRAELFKKTGNTYPTKN
jgi:hypothetical protein